MNTERPNPARDKSFAFALRTVALCRRIQEEIGDNTLTNQLLRSGTAIGLNIEEGIGSYSDKDFHGKFSIAYKEAKESHYWIRLLSESGYIEEDESMDLIQDVDELMRIVGSILKTMRSKND